LEVRGEDWKQQPQTSSEAILKPDAAEGDRVWGRERRAEGEGRKVEDRRKPKRPRIKG